MSRTMPIAYGTFGFWAYDVAVGIFLKYLIEAAETNPEAQAPWLAEVVKSWRSSAVISDFGVRLDSRWSVEQKKTFITLVENACTAIAARTLLSAQEILSWQLLDDLRIELRGAQTVDTAPIVELGHAIAALVCGTLPDAPKGEAWFFGAPEGRATIRMRTSWNSRS